MEAGASCRKTAVTKEGVGLCLRQMMATALPAHWTDDHRQSECLGLTGVDGQGYELTVEGGTEWKVKLTVEMNAESMEDGDEQKGRIAQQVNALMGWCHHWTAGEVLLLPYVFEDRAELRAKWSGQDIADAVCRNLQAVLDTRPCDCARSRMHDGSPMCSLCLIEGKPSCPICYAVIVEKAQATRCCGKVAHASCMSMCNDRCFNCRASPLAWV